MIGHKILQVVRLGLRNLVGYPLRTFLTTLGVVFGVGSVIAMLAMGTGAEQALLEEFGSLGINNIIINTVKPPEKKEDTRTSAWAFNRYGITFKDERQIRETVPGLAQILPVHKRRKSVWWGSRKLDATVYAVKARHMDLFGLRAVMGRTLAPLDGARLKRVCVIRAGLLRELGIFEEPIGIHLQVGEHYYRVVGVLEDEEFLGYARKALAIDTKSTEVYVPYETVFQRLGTQTVIQRQGSREMTDIELSQVVVSVDDIEDVVLTARMLKNALDRNHVDKDYELVVPLEVLRGRRKTQQVFNIALVAIASISLLVGGIGIANIMLATVTERTREIGIRRALGAKRRDILAQFLTETTFISGCGGVLGIGVGFGMIRILSAFADWPAIVTPQIVLLAVSISVVVGILSGIFPARRASLLDPIAALRHE